MEIECEFNDYSWELNGEEKELYTCTLKSANITEPETIVKSFVGIHEESKTDKDVEALWVEDLVIRFLPRGLWKFFPKLKILRVENCGLKKISRLDLEGLDELESVNVGKNGLTTIPDDLFEGKKKLIEVFLYCNLLTRVNSELLLPVKKTLKYADFENNPGVDISFEENRTFGDMMINTLNKLNGKDKEIAEKEKKLKAFSKTFEELQTSGTLAELVTIRGKEFKVHKCILAAQSSVFKEKFTNKATAAIETIKIEGDFSKEMFEEFIQFFYTQKVKNEEHAMDLLKLAVEYDVPHLKVVCEEIVTKSLNEGNVLEIYNTAHRQSFLILKRTAFDLVKQIHPEIPEYLYDKPEVVHINIQAKMEHEQNQPPAAKKPRLVIETSDVEMFNIYN